ncbi:MAG: serine/threonine-protein kinase, partial [Pirellulales bacterium]|nr:serine/threonine-protein kinase [Pirellulales bacterium]
MNNSVAIVEAEVPKKGPFKPSAEAAARDSRFTYPSGSRPLEGYVIKRGVGHGGFGEVYYATSDAGKEVALKLIRRNLEVELRGIRHCLNLKHPNLLSVFDIREDSQGDNWVVMEYVAGESLEEVIAANPAGMPAERALDWIAGISAGVSHLHDHGIVHRDLKPANIFNDQGMVKIGDYGLSKFISCSRRSGQTESIGTVHYMAPEVANGRYGKEIDVYALGVILYEMLTGRVPFEGESIGEVLMKHLTATPDVSMLPEPYRGVVARALEKDPSKRFGSAGEMLASLPKPSGAEGLGAVPPHDSRTAYDRRSARRAGLFGLPGGSAPATGEEPIFKAVRQGLSDLRQSWNRSNLNTPTKIALLIVLLVAAPFLLNTVLPLAVSLFALYVVYWIFRSLILTIKAPAPLPAPADRPPPAAPAAPAASPAQTATFVAEDIRRAVHREARLPRWARHERPAAALVVKPPRQRLVELVGSMLGGALIALLVCVLGFVLASLHSGGGIGARELARYAWVILASIVGTWAVLIPSKVWDGCKGDVKLRRLTMLITGLLVGVAAAAIAGALLVDLPHRVLAD